MIRFAAALATLLAAAPAVAADTPALTRGPTLRADVTVSGELVRISDIVENAGSAGTTAIYRAPDPGTTGLVPVASILAALRPHQLGNVETRGLRDVAVTRRARTVEPSEIEQAVSQVLMQRSGLTDGATLRLTFERGLQPQMLDAANTGALVPSIVRTDPRGRFDVTFEIDGADVATARLRFTGVAVETFETAVLTRDMDRGETIKTADLTIERKTRAEMGADVASRDKAQGMQLRRAVRTGQPIRNADITRPDLVQRDQAVTLIYEVSGIYLTMRGKAMESGTEGDVVAVQNLQSKRVVNGTVSGRSQVTVQAVAPRASESAALAPARPVALAAATPSSEKAE